MRLGPALLVALLPLLARANLATGATTLTTASTDEPTTTWNSSTTTTLQHSTTTSTTTAVGFPSTSIATTITTAPETPIVLDQQQEVTTWDVYDNSSLSNGESSLGANTTQSTVGTKMKSLTVGYLTAARGDLVERQGLIISGALTLALEEINNSTEYLPNVRLDLKWNDTHGETEKNTQSIVEMVCGGIAAFFGPEGKSCYVEAIVSKSMNIPMLNYKCSDHKASEVNTFARTEPPDTQVTKSIISLLRYYNWKKFLIIYQDVWSTVAKSLEVQAQNNSMVVNKTIKVYDEHTCCTRSLKCCQSTYWYEFIQDTKDKTRIYVFLGTASMLVDFMTTATNAQLFDNGDYMVIYVDMNTYADKEAYRYLWEPQTKANTTCIDYERKFLNRAKSLLVVVPTAPLTSYKEFSKKVQDYNAKEPFYFTTPPILLQYKKFISIYAAYLYDAVYLYVKALDTLLKQEKQLDDEKIDEIASDGTRIVAQIVRFGKYESVTGAVMKIDDNGDSEGNFSVLALTRVADPEVETLKGFLCDYQMRPVAQFYEKENSTLPEYKLLENRQIEWFKKSPPGDEPSCGFNNDKCPNPDVQQNATIWASILGALLFCTFVIVLSIYRKWKIEQEIEGLLWKIERIDIIGYDRNNLIPSPSRLSLGSASVNSYESRAGGQVFATTAHYRGVVVRIKKLTFSRKKDIISREVMKEMRLLRDLRHDNVNSFIGACVEPTSLLLVTDYCAKGSLYDIIENEDYKLDRMFVASLVHDLIKGMLYIHNSLLGVHGNLKSSNCVVTSRWVLQVTDFGLAEIRHCAENERESLGESIGEHQIYRSLFWKAPEFLREPTNYIRGTQSGDVYAFAIILYEIIGRRSPPFGTGGLEPKDIIDKIKEIPENAEDPFRPDLAFLQDTEFGCEEYILNCITECWAEDAALRPDFGMIRLRLKKMKDGEKKNIMDQMMEMMVKYANHLEDLVQERTRLLHEEKMKTVDLLHRMLPKPVAEKLTMGCGIEPEWFDQVTIYFSDIVGFTAMSAESTPLQVVNFLNDLYTVFDRIIKGYDVYKVETIGDAYMVVSGLPVRNGELHAGEIASMALDLLSAVKEHTILHRPNETVKLRIGIHTGPVVAGVVGLTMPRYCLFGDTVNTASRMESNGEPLKIHISGKCKEALEKIGGYIIEERGLVNMKGKGEVRTYWLEGATERAIQRREVDLGELPPLFCRPRRGSPRLNCDSRQASFCAGAGGFGGMTSRRHSSVPRGTSVEVESCSTLHNPSPLPIRNQFIRQNRHALVVPDSGSKLTVDSVFGVSAHHNDNEYPRGRLRSRRVLSSIASSCDEPSKSQHGLNKAREYKSLDLLPVLSKKKKYAPKRKLQRSARSLADCDRFYSGEIQIIAIPDDKFCNNNFPNGNVISRDDSLSDMEEPLLNSRNHNAIIESRFRTDDMMDDLASKRWKSLESVRTEPTSDTPSKKALPRNSIKSWIVGLFNGNGFPASNTVLNEYTIPLEKESIV